MIKNYLSCLKFSKRFLIKKGMPLYLIFFVTSKCNAKCKHCWYWKNINQDSNELGLDEIEKISKGLGGLMFLNLAGGEPFLRDNLPEIVRIFYKNNFVKNISTNTNGLLTKKIVSNTKDILKTCKDLYFTVNVSIDGIGKDHDEIRGVNGLFKKALNTYEKLRVLEEKYDKFSTGVSITVSSHNQHKLGSLYDFIKNKMGVKNISIFLTRGNPRETSVKNVNINRYEELSRLLEKDIKEGNLGYSGFPFSSVINLKDILMHDMIVDIVKNKRFILPCFAGTLSGVIYDNGDVYPCELLDQKMGNLRDSGYDFKKIWFSKKAENARKFIKDEECFCTHECFFNANILFNPKIFPLLIKELINAKILKNYMK